MRRVTIVLFTLILAQSATAQISHWQLGGSGLAWSENDTTRLFVDFATTPVPSSPRTSRWTRRFFLTSTIGPFGAIPATASSTT